MGEMELWIVTSIATRKSLVFSGETAEGDAYDHMKYYPMKSEFFVTCEKWETDEEGTPIRLISAETTREKNC